MRTDHAIQLYARAGSVPFARVGPCPNWLSLRWTRRAQANGEWRATFAPEAPEVRQGWLSPGQLVEIVRDGRTEFVGVITRQQRVYAETAPVDETIEISGTDALDGLVLRRRCVVPPSNVAYYGTTGAAETVLRQIMTDHVIAPQDGSRTIPGIGLPPANNPPLGQQVVVNLRGDMLADVFSRIALTGGVAFEGIINDASGQLLLRIYQGLQRVPGGTALPVLFSAATRMVTRFDWTRDLAQLQNRIYVAGGDGTAANRFTVAVDNSASEQTWGMWEGFQDGSNAYNTTIAQLQGAATLAQRGQIDRITLQLSPQGPYQYRKDFDLADTVQYAHGPWGLSGQGPIVQIDAEVTAQHGEVLTVTLNLYPESYLRAIRAALSLMTPRLYQPQFPALVDGRLALAQLTSDPVPGSGYPPLRAGQMYYNTATSQLRIFDGATWRTINWT